MGNKIIEFLKDDSATNFSVIITAIISTFLIGLISSFFKRAVIMLKDISIKGYKWVKFNVIKYKKKGNIIKRIKASRRSFYAIYEEYEKDKNSYNTVINNRLKNLKYLSKKQKKIRNNIISENKEKITKEDKVIKENLVKLMNDAVKTNQASLNRIFGNKNY